MNIGILQGLTAAALFGASVPLAKLLQGPGSPLAMAGLLYLGSGIGLLLWWLARRSRAHVAEAPLARGDWPWFGGAVFFGGVLAPALLMFGLLHTAASAAALLLNLEAVFTILIAWFVFKEHFDRRIVAGVICIALASVVLSWPRTGGVALADVSGPLLIALACLGWGIDNNLTRKIAAADPVQIAGIKGLVAGAINLALALTLQAALPPLTVVGAILVLGFFGYGISLVLFVLALRHIGAARTSAYFSAAPFLGAGLGLLLFAEPLSAAFIFASALMALGLWLHIGERHAHTHRHEPMSHSHRHTHDAHHQHTHDFAWDGREPHVHPHRHAPLIHSHPHFPDLHHRHRHPH